MRMVVSLTCAVIPFAMLADAQAQTRVLEFRTTEVTNPTLGLTADGRELVFDLLGHLYRMPVNGGSATQLTFGREYDGAPVVSPDGERVAFISSRGGSDGDVFIMDLRSGLISKVTEEFQAGNVAWRPDGNRLAYTSYLRREEYPAGLIPGFGAGTPLSVVSTVDASGRESRRIDGPSPIGGVFYLADGRLIWMIEERATSGGGIMQAPPIIATHVQALSVDGVSVSLGSVPLAINTPALDETGDGLYFAGRGALQHLSFATMETEIVASLDWTPDAVSVDSASGTIYAAAQGRLWRMGSDRNGFEQIPFIANVEMETLVPARLDWRPQEEPDVSPRAILTPRLSPDGKQLVFMAAGFLWEQPIEGGDARRLVAENSYQLDPAFSPDGSELAFVSDKFGNRQVKVLNLASGRIRTIASVPGASWALLPSWSADGRSIVFQRTDAISAPYRFMRVSSRGGEPEELGRSMGSWTARPQLAGDGKALYFTARTGNVANVYRQGLDADSVVQAVTDLSRHAHDAQVSPDQNWLAFRRNTEIWTARLGRDVLKDEDFRLFSNVGGRSFSFTADSQSIVYSEGKKIWRKPISEGPAVELPVGLALPRVVASPILLTDVRVLDLISGEFTAPTSLLVEEGRIKWIGPEAGRVLPEGTDRVDGQGRFAIPGIFDSHTHAAWSNQQITDDSLIAYGVTSVRDTGSRIDLLNARLDRADATGDPVPRYFHSGDILEGLMPLWGDAFLEIASEGEAREYVNLLDDLGAQFIKVYSSLPWHLKSIAAEEANRLGLPVAGHGLSAMEIVKSVNLGLTSLEHNGGNTNDDIVQLLAHSGTWLDPTLTVFGQGTPSMLSKSEALDERFRTYIPADAIAAANRQPVSEAALNAWIKDTLGPVRDKYSRGVRLLDGTDALMTSVFHGPSVHWSLQFFEWAGIPKIDVIRMGTIEAARVVGASDELGSLEPGKIADIVLLEANPLDEIANTLGIWHVIKNGHLFDPDTIRQ